MSNAFSGWNRHLISRSKRIVYWKLSFSFSKLLFNLFAFCVFVVKSVVWAFGSSPGKARGQVFKNITSSKTLQAANFKTRMMIFFISSSNTISRSKLSFYQRFKHNSKLTRWLFRSKVFPNPGSDRIFGSKSLFRAHFNSNCHFINVWKFCHYRRLKAIFKHFSTQHSSLYLHLWYIVQIIIRKKF